MAFWRTSAGAQLPKKYSRWSSCVGDDIDEFVVSKDCRERLVYRRRLHPLYLRRGIQAERLGKETSASSATPLTVIHILRR